MPSPPIAGAQRALAPGTKVDRYRLGERIGGGFGVVYAAENERGARFALKTLRASDGRDARQDARLVREARVANDIDHPAIVKVIATGTLDDGRPYLVMPLLEGRTLQQAIQEDGAMEPARAWRLLRAVAEALARAHAIGVVHRDVKPSNVFLVKETGEEESPRLLDFGLAHAIESAEGDEIVKLTQSGAPIGTPAYMAPEMWWGQPAAPSMDQYVLGATLFEALTGQPPFPEKSALKLMEQTLHGPLPSAIATGAPVDEAADTFLKRLLAKDPADRFPSMEAAITAGDAAFPAGAEATRAATSGAGAASSATATAPGRAAGTATLAAWHTGVIAAGLGALIGVGYAGEGRRSVIDWLQIGGFVQIPIVLGFALGAIVLPLSARKRPGETPRGALAWALAPALFGISGIYANWRAVESELLRVQGLDAFRVFCEGTYESNAARFLGFALSSILCASLVALPAAAAWSTLPSP
jgi:hypothetical protein